MSQPHLVAGVEQLDDRVRILIRHVGFELFLGPERVASLRARPALQALVLLAAEHCVVMRPVFDQGVLYQCAWVDLDVAAEVAPPERHHRPPSAGLPLFGALLSDGLAVRSLLVRHLHRRRDLFEVRLDDSAEAPQRLKVVHDSVVFLFDFYYYRYL